MSSLQTIVIEGRGILWVWEADCKEITDVTVHEKTIPMIEKITIRSAEGGEEWRVDCPKLSSIDIDGIDEEDVELEGRRIEGCADCRCSQFSW